MRPLLPILLRFRSPIFRWENRRKPLWINCFPFELNCNNHDIRSTHRRNVHIPPRTRVPISANYCTSTDRKSLNTLPSNHDLCFHHRRIASRPPRHRHPFSFIIRSPSATSVYYFRPHPLLASLHPSACYDPHSIALSRPLPSPVSLNKSCPLSLSLWGFELKFGRHIAEMYISPHPFLPIIVLGRRRLCFPFWKRA